MPFIQIVFALVLAVAVLAGTFGFGGVLLGRHGPAVIEGWQSRGWPAVPALIRRSEAVQQTTPTGTNRGPTGTHVVRVEYEYRVQGRPYTGTRRSLDHEGKIYSDTAARAIAAQLRPGTAATAHHDPRDPTASLLEPGVPLGGVIGVLAGAALIAAGGLPFVLGWRLHVYRRARRQRTGR